MLTPRLGPQGSARVQRPLRDPESWASRSWPGSRATPWNSSSPLRRTVPSEHLRSMSNGELRRVLLRGPRERGISRKKTQDAACRIYGIQQADAMPNVRVYHAGTRMVPRLGQVVTAGAAFSSFGHRPGVAPTWRRPASVAYGACEVISYQGNGSKRQIGVACNSSLICAVFVADTPCNTQLSAFPRYTPNHRPHLANPARAGPAFLFPGER